MSSGSSLSSAQGVALSATDIRILASLAELWLIGNTEPPRSLLQARMKFKSIGSLNNLLPNLERKGVISRPSSSTVAITPVGLQRPEIKGVKTPTNNIEHHKNIKSNLNPKQIEIFDVLADGKVHIRREVASQLGHPSHKGHFQNLLSGMKTVGLVSYPSSKEMELTEMCFLLPSGSDKIAASSTASRKLQRPSSNPHVIPDDNVYDAYDAETDVESAERKSAAVAPGNAVGAPASAIDLTYSDEDSDWNPEDDAPGNDVGAPALAPTIDLTYSDEDSDWNPEDDYQVASI